jgi:putative SOS response-associated peptidase YedK
MCGRLSNYLEWEAIHAFYNLFGVPLAVPGAYNVAPTSQIVTVVREDGGNAAHRARWGLVPHWAKEIPKGLSTINARAETIAEKPTWREPLKQGRCLIPVSGWYEWTEEQGGKQPWHFTRPEGGVLSLAGLWAYNRALDLRSCAIVVCAGSDATGLYHDRMPVILDRAEGEAWLEAPDLSLLKPYTGALRIAEANRAVGNVRNQGEWLLDPSAAGPGTASG